jgi:hypothetical protein
MVVLSASSTCLDAAAHKLETAKQDTGQKQHEVSKLCPLTTGMATPGYRTRRASTASSTERMRVTWDGGERFMCFPPGRCASASHEMAAI